MDILNVILLSLFSLIALFILTKLMGYRQMSEMSMFDYINGITIGSIAAEMATSLENDWWLPLTAMIVYALAAIVLSYISVNPKCCCNAESTAILICRIYRQSYWNPMAV